MNLQLIRDVFDEKFTLGRLSYNGVFFGFTCEDKDRRLEEGINAKVYGDTAIPRGKYKLILSYSHHFQRITPQLFDVPGFEGVRIHGGNTAADTEGCPLLGRVRTDNGVANCAERNSTLVGIIQADEDAAIDSWLEVL